MFLGKQQLVFAHMLMLVIASMLVAQTAPTAPTGPYRVAGTVVSSTDGHALARARVILSDVKSTRKPLSVLSGEDGSFAFQGLAAGKYSLQGAKRGYPIRGYQQHDLFWSAIVTGAGLDTEHLILRLVPDSYIIGKVLDENGDPVRHASVALYRVAREEGNGRIYPNRQVTTDDLGAFELGPNVPGTYFLKSQAEPWYAIRPPSTAAADRNPVPRQVDPALDVAYPPTYYNDITDGAAATPIQVRGGERVQADIHLSPVHSLHLLVRLPEGTYPQLQELGLGNEISAIRAEARSVAPGVWELSGVPEGKYRLSTSGRNGEMQVSDVLATSQAQEVDASTPEAMATVSIATAVIGEKSQPVELTVGLRVPGGMLRAFDTADAKGVAHLKNVPAGRYEVVGWTNTRGSYSVSRVAVSGGELSGRTIEVTAGAAVDVAVIFIRGQASVEGTVVRNGKALAGAMVVLVPEKPEDHADLFRRDQSDLDGTFTVHAVVPGNYTLVAIENGWDLDWARPEVIAAYLKRGEPIRIPEGTNSVVKAPGPIEAQPK